MKIVVAITGASGSVYGTRVLEKLSRTQNVEVHLVLSKAGARTAMLEMGLRAVDLKKKAAFSYRPGDIGCRLASGSFLTDGMVIAPCSIHTMSSIAHGITNTLITRAADVCLKERRRLILMVRETPFHTGHLKSMTALSEMGAIICPPIPGFYTKPQTIDDLVDHSVDRVLDLLGIPSPGAHRWNPDQQENHEEIE